MDLKGWFKSGRGQVVEGVVYLALAYGLVSWAIDSGNIVLYILAIVFLALAVKNFVLSVKTLFKKYEH